MKRTLASVLVCSVVAVMLSALSISAQQNYDWGKSFSATPSANGDIAIAVPLSGWQRSDAPADPNDPGMSAKRFPTSAQIVVHAYYNGKNTAGKSVIDQRAIIASVDWVNNQAHVVFTTAGLNLKGIVSLMVVPKVPGLNKAEGESVFINPKDQFAQGVEGYKVMYDADNKRVGKVTG
ncbi:MAG: hypothetical protein PHO56_00670 [Patescibacteria group bacterium]|nr:hypothetical protein [Patescibacteria group bacterium]